MGPPETALIPVELSTRHCLRANLDKGQTEAVATGFDAVQRLRY